MGVFLIIAVILIADHMGRSAGQRDVNRRPSSRPNQEQFDVTDDALLDISSRLYSMDVNGVYGQLELDLQTKTSSGTRVDKAPLPLFKKGIPKDVLARPTYAKMMAMFDNYLAAVNETEQVTPQENQEESSFLDAILATDVMRLTQQFLVAQGLAESNVGRFKEKLRSIWFGLYQRTPGTQGSSGFEHVFLGELKNGISGLHSWVRYQTEEAKGNINYLGYTRVAPIGENSVGLMELPMVFRGNYKPHSTLMIESSPELEIGLYTICFLARPDSLCPIKASPNKNGRVTTFKIQTFVSKFHGRRFVGSAYPTF